MTDADHPTVPSLERSPATVLAPTPAAPDEPPVVLSWWRELLIAGTFYLLYSLVRNTFGAGVESRSIAFRHARGVIKVEQFFGLWVEPQLQSWYLGLPFNGFIRGWNIFYGTGHFVVTIGVLIFALESMGEGAVRRVDVVGAILSVAVFSSLVFGLIEGRTYGWFFSDTPPSFWSFSISPIPFAFLITIVSLAAFIVWGVRRERAGSD